MLLPPRESEIPPERDRLKKRLNCRTDTVELLDIGSLESNGLSNCSLREELGSVIPEGQIDDSERFIDENNVSLRQLTTVLRL